MKDDSTCKKAILCDFEFSQDLPDVRIEMCRNCGKRVIYYKRGGEMDDAKYLRDHRRDTLQPHGPTAELFKKIYPDSRSLLERAGETQQGFKNREKREEIKGELLEKRTFLRRKVSGHPILRGKAELPSFVKRTGFQKRGNVS